ncbi:MAG: hypothetical protein R3F02_18620 [Thiolinea sp.]
MNPLKIIETGGHYGDLKLEGTRRTSRDQDIALLIRLKAGEVAEFGDIITRNVHHPIIIMGRGQVIIHSVDNQQFGGDGIQARTGHIHINYTNVEHVTPTRPYQVCERRGKETIAQCLERYGETVYDPDLLEWQRHPKYPGEIIAASHVDAIIQLYATRPDGYTLDPAGIITDIRMPHVRARIKHPKVQAVMGSENNDYDNIHIGTGTLDLEMPYIGPIVFNTLRNSAIGCKDAKVPPGACVKIKEVKPRPSFIPQDEKRTYNNKIFGFRPECIIEHCQAGHTAPENTSAPAGGNMITKELLIRMGVTPAAAEQWQDPLNVTAQNYGLNVPTVAEDWLAQLVHESQGFTRVRESLYYTTPQRLVDVWPQRFSLRRGSKKLCADDYVRNPKKLANEVYANRMGNGDPSTGDGFRFSGGGIGMLTGRDMWQAYADYSGNDVVNNPQLFDDKFISADSAGWMFAVAKGLIDEARADLVKEITKRINGGYIGLHERQLLTNVARNYFVEQGLHLQKPVSVPEPAADVVKQKLPPAPPTVSPPTPEPPEDKKKGKVLEPIREKLSGKKTHIGMLISGVLGIAAMFGILPGVTADQGAGMVQAAFATSGFRSAIPKLIILAIETYLKLKEFRNHDNRNLPAGR